MVIRAGWFYSGPGFWILWGKPIRIIQLCKPKMVQRKTGLMPDWMIENISWWQSICRPWRNRGLGYVCGVRTYKALAGFPRVSYLPWNTRWAAILRGTSGSRWAGVRPEACAKGALYNWYRSELQATQHCSLSAWFIVCHSDTEQSFVEQNTNLTSCAT